MFIFFTLLLLALADNVSLWNKFKLEHNKIYSSSEESKRFEIFVENLKFAELLNKLDASATYGVTKFADLTQEEFSNKYLSRCPAGTEVGELLPTLSAPMAYDWTEQAGIVNDPRDQGDCGSCWAFCTAEVVASVNAVAGNDLKILSPQQLVDCDKTQDGCDGGLENLALAYVVKNGLETEEDYPYKNAEGACAYDASADLTYISTHAMLPADKEELMAEYMYTYGPLTIALNANPLQLYTSGVMDPAHCNPNNLNHCTMGVGYDQTADEPYWKIQNSWGPGWGEKGCFRIAFGKNMCGLAEEPNYAVA